MSEILPFIPLIVAFGVLSAYYDVKERRIPNNLIVFALVAGLATHAAIVAKAYYAYGTVNWRYVLHQAMNMASATVIAVLLYYGDFAGPGDGKAIIAYSILIPISAYHRGYYLPYPGIVHLGISYALAYISIILGAMGTVRWKDVADTLAQMLRPRTLGKMFISIVALSQILTIGIQLVKIPATPMMTFVYTIILVMAFERISEKLFRALVIVGITLYAVRLAFQPTLFSLLPKMAVAAVILSIIFAPLRVAMRNVQGKSIPMAVFLFVGALITLLAAW